MSISFDLMVVAACGIWIIGITHSFLMEKKAESDRFKKISTLKQQGTVSDPVLEQES